MPKIRTRKSRRGPLPFRYVLLLSFAFFIFSTLIGLWIVDKSIKPTLMSFAETETQKIASLVVNNAVNQKATMDYKDVVTIYRNNNGDITGVTQNFPVINKIKTEVTNLILINLKKAEDGDTAALESLTNLSLNKTAENKRKGTVYSVPLGEATKVALLGNLGPKIPVQFHFVGDVMPDIKYDVVPSGINNSKVSVMMHIEVNVQVIIPFETAMTHYKEDVPIGVLGYFPGEVPQYFNGNGTGSSPSIQIPSKSNTGK
jgi:sporulation protein YunB